MSQHDYLWREHWAPPWDADHELTKAEIDALHAQILEALQVLTLLPSCKAPYEKYVSTQQGQGAA